MGKILKLKTKLCLADTIYVILANTLYSLKKRHITFINQGSILFSISNALFPISFMMQSVFAQDLAHHVSWLLTRTRLSALFLL